MNTTHRNKDFSWIWRKELNRLISWIWLKELNPFSKYYSKNWTLFKIWLEELNIFQWNFFNMTQNFKFSQYDLKSWTHFFKWFTDLTFLEKWVKYLNPFWTWLKELKFFHLIQIIEPYFKIGSKNWIFKAILSIEFFENKKNTEKIERIDWTLLGYHSKDWTFLLKIWLKEPFFFFAQFDSKNCSFFFHDSNTWTFFTWLKKLNLLFLRDSNTWFFFWKFLIQRNGPFFFQDSKFFHQKKITHRIELFVNPTHRIDIFFVNTIHRIDPFFNTTHRIEHFLNTTHRIEHFLNTTHRIEHFLNMTQRIEPFNFLNMTQRWTVQFLEYDAKNWTLFQNMTRRIEHFSIKLFQYDSKN